MKKMLLIVVAVTALTTAVSAQKSEAPRIVLKSNFLSLPLGNVNLGSEMRIAERWSLAADATFTVFNLWGKVPHGANVANVDATPDDLDGYYTDGWSGFFEARYYFKQALSGAHLGAYAMGGRYGMAQMDGGWQSLLMAGGLQHRVYNAYVASAGVSFGYSFKFAERNRNYWGLDLYIGAGLLYAQYVNLLPAESQNKRAIGWTLAKSGVALSYTF